MDVYQLWFVWAGETSRVAGVGRQESGLSGKRLELSVQAETLSTFRQHGEGPANQRAFSAFL